MKKPKFYAMMVAGIPVLDNVKIKSEWYKDFLLCPYLWGFPIAQCGSFTGWMDKMELVEVFKR